MNALGNYAPVLKTIDDLTDKYPDSSAEGFPETWTDPLELYGSYVHELIELDLDKERNDLLALLEDKSPEWVWENRVNLVAERIFIRDF